MMRKTMMVFGVVAAVFLGSAATASASTEAADGGAPACVQVASQGGSVGTTLFVTVHNACGREYRVLVVINRAPDSSCFTLPAGGTQGLKFVGVEPTVAAVELC
jgi:hypothetical protein